MLSSLQYWHKCQLVTHASFCVWVLNELARRGGYLHVLLILWVISNERYSPMWLIHWTYLLLIWPLSCVVPSCLLIETWATLRYWTIDKVAPTESNIVKWTFHSSDPQNWYWTVSKSTNFRTGSFVCVYLTATQYPLLVKNVF